MKKQATTAPSPAPAPAAPVHALIRIGCEQITASPFNRERSKRYSKFTLQDLADNLKQHGQIEPAIVRALPDGKLGQYEMVAGERRWVASQMAGLREIDCIVRDLTDRQVCDIMLSENLQRENLKPVEEACVFADMLKATDHEGNRIYDTFDDLFIVTGRKRGVIENRLRLLSCPEFLLGAIDAGIAPARNGEMVGRVPNPARREEAAKRSLQSMYREGPMTVKECATMLSKEFMVTLDGCGFDLDDAEILPVEFDDKGVRCAGGACKDCPLRSENDPSVADLLMEAGTGSGAKAGVDPKICQNPPCLERKQAAVWKQIESAAEAKGLRIMPKEKGKALIAGFNSDLGVYVVEGEKYIAQDEMPGHEHTGHFANDDHPTWGTLIDGAHPAWLIVKDGRKPRYFLESEIAVQSAELLLKRAGKVSIFKKKKVGLGKAAADPNVPVEDAGAPNKPEGVSLGYGGSSSPPAAGASVAASVTKTKPGDRAAMVDMMRKLQALVALGVSQRNSDMARVTFSHVLTRFTGEEGAKLLLEMVGCGDAETRDWQNWDIAAAHMCETYEDYLALTITAVLARFMAQWGLEWIGWTEWTGALGVEDEVSGEESTVNSDASRSLEDYCCDLCGAHLHVPFGSGAIVAATPRGELHCKEHGGTWDKFLDIFGRNHDDTGWVEKRPGVAAETDDSIGDALPQYTDADALPPPVKKKRGRPPGKKTIVKAASKAAPAAKWKAAAKAKLPARKGPKVIKVVGRAKKK